MTESAKTLIEMNFRSGREFLLTNQPTFPQEIFGAMNRKYPFASQSRARNQQMRNWRNQHLPTQW